ncbi:MAG: multicopper oxidase domain-containing protein, partial [Hymenobacteraceae bacterium]|nr:multicopper oxidase domain-containing protein [Hymenobacteraceae bacterium]MDX5396972.1 multicopper oxidase domain-containing protein [Hymenobacteraceae bacterium]MDX5513046.1 multicopper oxidase domain-containing protein [Hymenobacteraceae bacterium]
YWYHSHTDYQEQKGMYGAIVIHPKVKQKEIPEKVIVLADFTDQNPWNVQRLLKGHTEWYAIQRNAVQSYGKAIAKGYLKELAWLEWNRMPSMDLADVYYDAFTANGKLEDQVPDLQPGETIRLRVVNGSASSNFWLHFAGGPLKVVAADGLDVAPVSVDKLLIATAETYDFEITLPANGQYEFRATSWDRYKHTSVWLGQGERHKAQDLPPVDYFALIKEMKEMMAMMPDMTMGKAPQDRPETKLYAPGTAPSYQEMNMQVMQEMGMKMEMNHEGHQKMDMPEKQQPQHQDHSMHQMQQPDTAMHNNHMQNSRMQGKIEAEKAMQNAQKEKPMGVMMTGYKQLKNQFPEDTIFNYNMLRATHETTLPDDRPVRIVHLFLTGNMFRYVWMINNKPLSRGDKILIKKGENVRFVMRNTTMMSHPMHLHGHFFRVINAQGEYSPLKHTVNIAPMENTIIEFQASEEKDWFFHCHLLYHMLSGMARVVRYENTNPLANSSEKFKKFVSEDKKYFPKASATIQSNGYWGDVSVFNNYNELSLEGDGNYDGEYDAEAKLIRYIGPKQFFTVYLGGEFEGTKVKQPEAGKDKIESENLALVGVRYFLPMHLWSDLRVDHKGKVQVELEREDLALTRKWRISGGVEYNISDNEWEYTAGTSYILGQYFALSGNYDSDYGWGAGIQFIY